MRGGHVGQVPGFVKAGGRVEITAQGLHLAGHLAFGPVLRALEDHMFKHMADARMARLFIGRTRAHVQAGADQGETRVLENIDGEPVGQPGQHLVRRNGRGSGGAPGGNGLTDGKQDGGRAKQRRCQKGGTMSHENS